MVPRLEAVKGGGGSVKLGTTGTISALMLKELNSMNSATHTLASPRTRSPMVSLFVPSNTMTPKRLKPRTSADEARSSGSSNSMHGKNHEIVKKTKHHNRERHHVPMLDSDNLSVDGTPIRKNPDRKGSYIAEIVDINCGNPDRPWASRLKKLGFSKLSESNV